MRTILIIVGLLFSSTSLASIYCGGKINNSYISKDGNLIIRGDWRNDYTRLCNLKGSVGGVDSITCSMWASYVATSISSGKKVLLSYPDNSLTCSTLPTYTSSPTPNYFMLTGEAVL